MTNNKLVLTTAGSKEEAQKIARTLVERRLAACDHVVAMRAQGPGHAVACWNPLDIAA